MKDKERQWAPPLNDVKEYINLGYMQMKPDELAEFEQTIERLEREAEYGLVHATPRVNDAWKRQDVVQIVEEGDADAATDKSP